MTVSKDRDQQAKDLKVTHENLIERATEMKDAGYSAVEIANALGISENDIRSMLTPKTEIKEEETIWFPGPYGGRTDAAYTQIATHLNFEDLVTLVQKRAQEDGEWTIANGFVGNNEANMRKMMAFVSDEKNIRQVVEYIHKEELDHVRTVDFVCRDLANASKYAHGS